jgi:23S rRNA pseudouridine2605 synthase
MNLNAFLSRNGVCSRRKAAELIKEGGVTVNGEAVVEPWYQVKPRDVVKAAGRTVGSRHHVYIVINKPKGVTVTLEDRFASNKVTDLIPQKFGRVYPVGRLDRDSRGLLIMTSDGDLCHRLTHPRFEVEKEYLVTVKGGVDEPVLKRLKRGVKDGPDLLKVKSARIEKASPGKSVVRVVICEGKKRHLRRLFAFIGLEVRDLARVRIAGLMLGDLKDGRFRTMSRQEICALLGMKYQEDAPLQ